MIRKRILKKIRSLTNTGAQSAPERDESLTISRHHETRSKNPSANKIFCIGANKTGTTTIEKALKDLDYKIPHQKIQETELTHLTVCGDWHRFRKFVQKFDAFQDLPFSTDHNYIACDSLFPGSKFILTLRDPDEWYESMIRFYNTVFDLKDEKLATESTFKDKKIVLHKNYFYEYFRRSVLLKDRDTLVERWDLLFDKQFRIEQFNRRNEDILKYFYSRKNDLLTLDVSEENDTQKITRFLNLNDDNIRAMPHLNATR